MGEVIAVFRIMPDSPENTTKVKEQLEAMKPTRIEEEPVAFGLIAFKATFMFPDEGGQMDIMENKLNDIKGSQAVETLTVSRSL